MRSRKSLLLAAVVGGLAVSSAGLAYTPLVWTWAWQGDPLSQPFYIVPNFPGSAGSTANVRAAMVDGMDRWGDESGSDFAFTYAGDGATPPGGNGGEFVAQYTSSYASGGTLAVASSWGWSGNMQECGIVFYAGNAYGSINWEADQNGATSQEMDLEYVATHEFGHCAGLDHSTVVSSRYPVMYPSAFNGAGPSDRTLSNDDKAGMQAIYGLAPSTPQGLTLGLGDVLQAGQPASISVTGANPGEEVWLVGSPTGLGSGPCYSQIGGLCMDILAPITVIGSSTANAQGEVAFSITPPARFAGYDMGFQAVVLRGAGNANSVASNADGYTVLGTGFSCPAGEVPDCAGNCYDDTWPGDGYCDDGQTYNWGSPDFLCAIYDFDQGDCGP